MKEIINLHSETFAVKLYQKENMGKRKPEFLPPRGTSECLLRGELQLYLSPNVVEEAPGVFSLMQTPAFHRKVLRHQS